MSLASVGVILPIAFSSATCVADKVGLGPQSRAACQPYKETEIEAKTEAMTEPERESETESESESRDRDRDGNRASPYHDHSSTICRTREIRHRRVPARRIKQQCSASGGRELVVVGHMDLHVTHSQQERERAHARDRERASERKRERAVRMGGAGRGGGQPSTDLLCGGIERH